MFIKVIKFAIKFKIFDFHYPHIPFCNFQNRVSEKMWCCLTFVCVYISHFRRRYFRWRVLFRKDLQNFLKIIWFYTPPSLCNYPTSVVVARYRIMCIVHVRKLKCRLFQLNVYYSPLKFLGNSKVYTSFFISSIHSQHGNCGKFLTDTCPMIIMHPEMQRAYPWFDMNRGTCIDYRNGNIRAS